MSAAAVATAVPTASEAVADAADAAITIYHPASRGLLASEVELPAGGWPLPASPHHP